MAERKGEKTYFGLSESEAPRQVRDLIDGRVAFEDLNDGEIADLGAFFFLFSEPLEIEE